MLQSSGGPALREQLADWTAGGLIDAGQAARIEAAEADRAAVPPGARRASPGRRAVPGRRPLAAEALGYLGGVLAVAGGLIAVGQLWPGIPVGAEVAFAVIAAAATLLAGIRLPAADHRALARLRSVLWLLSAVSLAAAGALLGRSWPLGPTLGPLAAEAVATAYAALLWWHWRAAAQQLAVFSGAAALVGTALARAWPAQPPWATGLGIWVLSLLWGIAAHRGYLVPRTAGYAAAGLGLLAGAQLMMDRPAGQVLAVATVAGLLAAGATLHRVFFLASGALGAAVILPEAAIRYLPAGPGAAAGVFAAGLVILGVALRLTRTRHRTTPRALP